MYSTSKIRPVGCNGHAKQFIVTEAMFSYSVFNPAMLAVERTTSLLRTEDAARPLCFARSRVNKDNTL